MAKSSELVHNCLYFTAGSLSRVITRMADEAFRSTGLSPSHAFVLMLAAEEPGIGPGELAARLSLAPSTVTRFVDALVAKGLLNRTSQGRAARIAATPAGLALLKGIEQAWRRLHRMYLDKLGPEAETLVRGIDAACRVLSPDEA